MSGPDAAVLIVGATGASIIGLTWLKMHYSSRKAIKNADVAAIEARLARTEQAVDAIAVEAERISEGQRFTTKLLSERALARSEAR